MKKYIIIIIVISALIVGISLFMKDGSEEVYFDNTSTSYIRLNSSSISLKNSNAKVSGSKVTIVSGGNYEISGSLSDGQIIIDTNDIVNIVLDGININCSNSSPIYIKSSDKTTITLKKNTVSTLTDGTSYKVDSNDEPDGTLFSKDDLIIDGLGSLVINASYKDGIVSKDDLIIESGNITITSNDDGIKGKDSVVINEGVININSKADGIKSTNDSDSSKGYVKIINGTFNITSGEDGIQAETNVEIENGTFTIQSGSGSSNSSTNSSWGKWNNGSESSAKGIKATNLITINNGEFNIDSSDDSIHSNNELVINNGTFNISSGDDGMHADNKLTVNDGNIDITKSYEGMESADLIFNGGNIKVVASDDGINAAGGVDSSAISNNRPGGMGMMSSSTGTLTINNGYIYVDAKGDGIDVNGSLSMKNGTVIVNGPSDNGNGSLDYDGTFTIDGGLLIATGSSGMAQGISTTSKQNGVLINFSDSYQANTLVNISDSNGNSILTFSPSKTFSSIAISSSDLIKGNTYNVNINGSCNGNVTNGVYDGTYSNGEKYTSFTISSTSTTIGSSMGNMNMGRR